MKNYLTFRSMTAALAVGSMLAVTLVPVSASAGRYGGYHRGHYHHHHGGSRGGDIAVGVLGGLLVGAAIMSAAQPRTYAPAPTYAPYGGGYGGGYGAVDATPASEVYRAPNGQYCRDYTSASGYGTACLDGDGVWRTVN